MRRAVQRALCRLFGHRWRGVGSAALERDGFRSHRVAVVVCGRCARPGIVPPVEVRP